MESDPEFHGWILRYVNIRSRKVPESSEKEAAPYLFQRYPFFATPFKDALERLLAQAKDISSHLHRPVIVFGGVTKGTATPTSDLDIAIVSRDHVDPPECHQWVPVITPSSTDPDSLSIVFSGNAIFTGSKRVLRDVQRDILERVSEQQWERGRKHAAQQEAEIHHVVSIYRISPYRAPLVGTLKMIDRVPPRLETARRIFHVV